MWLQSIGLVITVLNFQLNCIGSVLATVLLGETYHHHHHHLF